jgi:uncharacterized protein YacL
MAVNMRDLAASLRPSLAAGETAQVTITKRGEGERQGVGYLPDGTMVVVEDAHSRIGSTLQVTVTNAVSTAAGRLLFARIEGEAPATAASMADAATRQTRHTGRPGRSFPA